MPAKNPRINITLEEATAGLLAQLAQQENKPVASLARDLIMEALERREDMGLSALAEIRDKPEAKRVTHDDAWQ